MIAASSRTSLPLVAIIFLSTGFFIPLAASARCSCMNRILMLMWYDDFRIILSPDYPQTYCANLTCTWRIAAPDNQSNVHFFARNIDLRDGKDFIKFYESSKGMDLDENLGNSSHSCTGATNCKFRSQTQFLTIQFTSGSGEPDHYGFQGTISLYDRTLHRSLLSVLAVPIALGAAFVAFIVAVGFVVYRQLFKANKFKSSSAGIDDGRLYEMVATDDVEPLNATDTRTLDSGRKIDNV